jgi:hypothetical protein
MEPMMNVQPPDPAAVAQRQLDAYNAHDLERFVAEYTDDVEVYRMPGNVLALAGKAAFAAHYASKRFNLPQLHARLVNRIVAGDIVVDHEEITGLSETTMSAIAVYKVVGDKIKTVWFY